MLHSLHGNAGLPDDLLPLLSVAGREFRAWHLWEWLRENPNAASFDGFAAALNAAAAGERPRVLLGYSLGARLGLYALTQQPQRWDAAILLSGHPGLTNEYEREPRRTVDHAWALRFRSEPWMELMGAWNAQPVLAGAGVPPGQQQLTEPWRSEIAQSFDVWSLARQPDLRPLLPSVGCPVLWITGERDAKFTALAAEASALMPHSQHVIIPGAGHRVHLDQPAAAAKCVRDFLTTV